MEIGQGAKDFRPGQACSTSGTLQHFLCPVHVQIVVHGLPWSTEWQELKDLAKEHGDVIKADVMKRPDGKSRGFGTIVFKTPEDAQAAIEVSVCALCML